MGATLRVLRSMGSLIGLLLAGHAMAVDGLRVADPSAPWPRWQARLDLTEAPGTRLGMASAPAVRPPIRATLVGDYDLGRFDLGMHQATGRLRATGGLLFGLHAPVGGNVAAWNGQGGGVSPSAPYLGVGYTGWSTRTGLSFTADLGLTADYPGGTWRFGRALFGNQGADDVLRELRLQPRLQLGMQYRY